MENLEPCGNLVGMFTELLLIGGPMWAGMFAGALQNVPKKRTKARRRRARKIRQMRRLCEAAFSTQPPA